MTSGITRLHIDLSHFPQFCRSSKFTCCKNNNNPNYRSAPYPSNNLLIKSKQKSISQMQSRSDSFFQNIPIPVRSSTASSPAVHPSANPTHPYLRDGWSVLRKPKRFLPSTNTQLTSKYPDPFPAQLNDTPQNTNIKSASFQGEESLGLTVEQRKQLLMTSIPHLRRSITPNEYSIENRSDPKETKSQTRTPHEVSVEANSNEENANSLISIAPIPPISIELNSVKDTNFLQTRYPPIDEPASLSTRPKLSLNRRCSEATLPLTFSFKMPKKSCKSELTTPLDLSIVSCL